MNTLPSLLNRLWHHQAASEFYHPRQSAWIIVPSVTGRISDVFGYLYCYTIQSRMLLAGILSWRANSVIGLDFLDKGKLSDESSTRSFRTRKLREREE
jgi:hypothetical protein